MRQTGARGVALGTSILTGWMLMQFSPGLHAQEDGRALADLTELPAMRVENAEHTVQLAVASAGDRLVSVGEQGIVLLSDDHGENWYQASEVPVSVTLTDVEFVSDTEGWAVGHSGVVLRTRSAGERWVRVMTGEEVVTIIQDAVQSMPDNAPGAKVIKRNASYLTGNEPILDAYFSGTGEAWLIGAYGIALHSLNGGQTWESAFSNTGNLQSYHLYQFIPSSGSKRLIVGERGLVSGSVTDRGIFEPMPIGYEGTFFGGVSLNSEDFILFGLRGNVWMGEEGSWRRIQTGSEASFSAGIMTPVGIVLGDVTGRLFLKSRDSDELRELAQASDAAITDLEMTPQGELVMSTARGLKRLNLDNTEFK